MWDQILTQGTWQGELWDRRKNGERYYEQLSITTVRDPDGSIANYHALIRDVTDRKMAEQALWRLNDNLERLVTERTSDLKTANLKLQHTLETLQRAQAELVRSEKLASLGSMVAGVAHELNTPLGNSLTVITALADSARDFAAQVQARALRRSQLTDFVAYALKAADLVTHNLSRANDLITHFKQVAVDQTSVQRRQFDLKQAIGETVEILQPQFKRGAHRVVVDIPEGIRMDSFPGPLSQIVTNLLNNALVHAFDGVEVGVISIRAQPPAIVRSVCSLQTTAAYRAEQLMPFLTRSAPRAWGAEALGLHIVFRWRPVSLEGDRHREQPGRRHSSH
jgi:signal transduction histidine kinase